MTRKALVVGINCYPNFRGRNERQDLPNAPLDAEAIAQILRDYGRFEVTLLPETCADGAYQVDEKGIVKAKTLQDAIYELFVEPRDGKLPRTALLFFAGHGLAIDEYGETVGYLATSETNLEQQKWGVRLDWLAKILGKSKVSEQIVWLDCCHSGKLTSELFEQAKPANQDDMKRFIIAACRDSETAHGVDGHGVLTYLLQKALDAERYSVDTDVNSLAVQQAVEVEFHAHPKFKTYPQRPIFFSFGRPIHFWDGRRIKSVQGKEAEIYSFGINKNRQAVGVKLNKGVLRDINKPVKPQAKSSSVRLISSSNKQKVRDLLILDPEIANSWGESPQNIWIYEDQTLASLRIEDLRTGKIIWNSVRYIESRDLFLPEFIFVDVEDALPGAFLPDGTQINFNDKTITPLIPLNPILLDYLTPEDLIKRIKLTVFNGSEGHLVRVIIDLPLSGLGNDDTQPQNFRIYKDYPIKEQNALAEVPVLELWPRFRAEGWKEYYAFYYDGEYGEETFQVSWPEAKEPHIFQEGRGSYQITRLEEFPSFINCQDRARNTIGLILLKTPDEIKLTTSWIVGVDFGTYFTNIYVNRKEIVEPLPLENLHLKVAEVGNDTRIPVLFKCFIPEHFIPTEKPLPLLNVLTTRGKRNTKAGEERPIYDGRIYVPDWFRLKLEEDWIARETKFKLLLHKINFYRFGQLFIKHLALHITALAAKNGVKQIQWSLSYPSALSKANRTRYALTWQTLTKELEEKTGIIHISPQLDDLDYFRTESLAIAQYFADYEDHNLVNATCIDIGGTTSDISIWKNNQQVHQCSIQLSGTELLSQFLELKPEFLEHLWQVTDLELKGLKEGYFRVKLAHLLRLEADNWLKKQRAFVEDDPEFQGLLRLMAIGFSGLYYYVGTILGVLHDEGKYNGREITPVYIGGNGSRLLNWLAIGGQFDRHSEINYLLSRMLSGGSGFDDTGEITRLSQRPKDEVCYGLVLSSTKLQGLTRKTKDPLIAGEDYEVNGNQISWRDRLELEGNIEQFQISEFEQLSKFLDEFNLALQELEIEGLKPMKGFKAGVGLEADYSERLWRETKRELTIRGESDNISIEPPFILGLKALLRVLGKEWAGK